LAVAPSSSHIERAAFRRFRRPVPVRVSTTSGRPAHLTGVPGTTGRGRVRMLAGPWRTSGDWWAKAAWDRDEWDVELDDRGVYRIHRDRVTGQWFMDGYWD
jgi:protein ImuB